jgi:AcrR family transcriptional regulator
MAVDEGVERVRCRICDALLELVVTQGYAQTTVAQILEQAGVNQCDFERLFSSKEECTMAVFDLHQGAIEREIIAAYEAEDEWPTSLRAAAYAVAQWMVEHPREMRFGTVEILWVSEYAQARREVGFQKFIGFIDEGRRRAKDPASIPPSTAEGVMGSIAEMLTKRIAQGDARDPYAVVPELMYLAVRPYLGEDAAARELAIPPPLRPAADS